MIWWVMGAAVLVVIGLGYVMRHESDLCAPYPDERPPADPRRADASAITTRRAA